MTPDDLYYSKEHEWLRLEGDSATIGITDHAQQELGDIVYVELPDPDTALEADEVMGSVESVKAVSEIFCPVAGTVTEVNGSLEDAPEVVNSDPYGDGWLIRLRLDDAGSPAATMLSAGDYRRSKPYVPSRPVSVATCAVRSAAVPVWRPPPGGLAGVPSRYAIPAQSRLRGSAPLTSWEPAAVRVSLSKPARDSGPRVSERTARRGFASAQAPRQTQRTWAGRPSPEGRTVRASEASHAGQSPIHSESDFRSPSAEPTWSAPPSQR